MPLIQSVCGSAVMVLQAGSPNRRAGSEIRPTTEARPEIWPFFSAVGITMTRGPCALTPICLNPYHDSLKITQPIVYWGSD